MADNCTLPRRSGTSSLPNQVFAPSVMLPRAPFTIRIIMTFEARWIVVISNASSWYFSTFSFSVLVMFWSAGTTMSLSVHLCVSLYALDFWPMMHCNFWPIMLQHFVCEDSGVPGYPYFSIFCDWQGLMVIPLVSTPYPILPAHLPVYPQGHHVVTLPIRSLVSFFHPLTMCRTVQVVSLQNLHSGVS